MDKLTDAELALQIELHETRIALYEEASRRASIERALAMTSAQSTNTELVALRAEQEARAKKAADAASAK